MHKRSKRKFPWLPSKSYPWGQEWRTLRSLHTGIIETVLKSKALVAVAKFPSIRSEVQETNLLMDEVIKLAIGLRSEEYKNSD